MVNIEAIEKSVMTTTDEKMLKQMAESMPFDIYQQLSPEARSKLAKVYGKEVPAASPYMGVLPMKRQDKFEVGPTFKGIPPSERKKYYETLKTTKGTHRKLTEPKEFEDEDWYYPKAGRFADADGIRKPLGKEIAEIKLIKAEKRDSNITFKLKVGKHIYTGLYNLKSGIVAFNQPLLTPGFLQLNYDDLKVKLKKWVEEESMAQKSPTTKQLEARLRFAERSTALFGKRRV